MAGSKVEEEEEEVSLIDSIAISLCRMYHNSESQLFRAGLLDSCSVPSASLHLREALVGKLEAALDRTAEPTTLPIRRPNTASSAVTTRRRLKSADSGRQRRLDGFSSSSDSDRDEQDTRRNTMQQLRSKRRVEVKRASADFLSSSDAPQEVEDVQPDETKATGFSSTGETAIIGKEERDLFSTEDTQPSTLILQNSSKRLSSSSAGGEWRGADGSDDNDDQRVSAPVSTSDFLFGSDGSQFVERLASCDDGYNAPGSAVRVTGQKRSYRFSSSDDEVGRRHKFASVRDDGFSPFGAEQTAGQAQPSWERSVVAVAEMDERTLACCDVVKETMEVDCNSLMANGGELFSTSDEDVEKQQQLLISAVSQQRSGFLDVNNNLTFSFERQTSSKTDGQLLFSDDQG